VLHQPDTVYHCRVRAKVEDDWCVWRCVNKDVILLAVVLHASSEPSFWIFPPGRFTHAHIPDMRLNDEDIKDCYN
jgi:hypothetical protein